MNSNYITKHHFHPMPICNCHVHIMRPHPVDESVTLYQNMRSYLNVERILILGLEADSLLLDNTSNIQALYMKEKMDYTYAFASFVYDEVSPATPEGILEQAKFYETVGFDGIKMLEGKQNFHTRYNCKLDGPVYEPFWSYAEKKGIPILMHLGDTVDSFLPDRMHEKEMLHAEMEHVLKKFPKLNIIFAHFYFMSHDMNRLEQLFSKYENVKIDLTLGGDFLINFSEDIETWRDFFIRHSKRILFGTDCYNLYFSPEDDYEITNRYAPVRDFLERDGTYIAECYTKFLGKKMPLRAACLPEAVLEDIYRNNFIRFLGEQPKQINHILAESYCKRLMEGYRTGKLTTCALVELPDYFAPDEKANMARGMELAMENLQVIRQHFTK